MQDNKKKDDITNLITFFGAILVPWILLIVFIIATWDSIGKYIFGVYVAIELLIGLWCIYQARH